MGTQHNNIFFKEKNRGDGSMQKIPYLILIILLSLCVSSCFEVSADDTISVNISIIDQPAQIENEKPKIIAGLWHSLSFSGIEDNYNEIILTMYYGSTLPLEKNMTNYFQWKYTPLVVNSWQQTTTYGNKTINPDKCWKESDLITFCVGIPDSLPSVIFYNEEWTFELSISNEIIYQDKFYLEKPTKGFAKSHGDRLSFSVDPFTEMNAEASDFLILKNTGNIPLNITLDFNVLDYLLSYTESSNQISAFSQQNYRLELNAPSWKPQRIQQSGSASAYVSEYFLLDEDVSGTAISLKTALIIDVPTINIFVGHKNYQLTTLNSLTGFSFQYQKSISMSEGEIRTINSYLSGEGTAKITIQTNENISVLQMNKNDLPANSPFTIISTNENEQVISIKFKALSENRDGKITYIVETDGEMKSFTTKIDVGPPTTINQPSAIDGTSPITIIVLLALIFVAGYMLYNHLVHGRSERR